MSELREKLAERLHEVWCSWKFDGGRQTPHAPLSDGDWGQGYAVADECIRQMEWARRELFAAAMDSGRSNPIAGPIIRAATPTPLTAAPDDWKVPE